MKEFILTTNKKFTFGDCSNCEARCCKGSFGTVYTQIILEEFEKVWQNFPILFTIGDLGYVKPVILLTNSINSCPYLQDSKCSIYEKRPTVCRTYPLSPSISNEIYIDKTCPEVNKGEFTIVDNNEIHENYKETIFDNYQEKFIETFYKFEKVDIKKDLTLIHEVQGIELYKFNKTSKCEYIKIHQDSLRNLKKFKLIA